MTIISDDTSSGNIFSTYVGHMPWQQKCRITSRGRGLNKSTFFKTGDRSELQLFHSLGVELECFEISTKGFLPYWRFFWKSSGIIDNCMELNHRSPVCVCSWPEEWGFLRLHGYWQRFSWEKSFDWSMKNIFSCGSLYFLFFFQRIKKYCKWLKKSGYIKLNPFQN